MRTRRGNSWWRHLTICAARLPAAPPPQLGELLAAFRFHFGTAPDVRSVNTQLKSFIALSKTALCWKGSDKIAQQGFVIIPLWRNLPCEVLVVHSIQRNQIKRIKPNEVGLLPVSTMKYTFIFLNTLKFLSHFTLVVLVYRSCFALF